MNRLLKISAKPMNDFFISTSLTNDQLKRVITPMLDELRDGISDHEIYSIIESLEDAYPEDFVTLYIETENITF